jgi:hypothetical protein
MNSWTPPARTKVLFSVEPTKAPTRETWPGVEAKREELFIALGLNPVDSGHTTLRIGDPRWPAILEALSGDRTGFRFGACWFEEPEPKPQPDSWFIVWGPTPFKSPARPPTSVHLAWRDGQDVASGRFRETIEAAGLTGLSWLPLEDSKPTDSSPWFEVFASEPIGRGLDHPLIDPRKYEAYMTSQKFDLSRRWGERKAKPPYLRSDVRIECPLCDYFRSHLPPHFRVSGPYRFVREHLPSTDFAYMGWGFERDKGPGYEGRPVRTICCNARARTVLIEAGLVRPMRFEPMLTVLTQDANAEVLDRTISAPMPLPMYTLEEATAERARREALLKRSRRKITSYASIEEAVAALETLLAGTPAPWVPSRDDPNFVAIHKSKLYIKTPETWRRIAPLLPVTVTGSLPTDSTDAPFEFEMVPPAWNGWLSDEPGDPDETPSKRDLVIGQTPYGDWFAFRKTDPLLPHDARIVHWDHETASIASEWPSVAAFVSEIVDVISSPGMST